MIVMCWLLCFICLSGVVFAQSTEKQFTTLLDSAKVLQNKRKYEAAVQICKVAMTVAEKQWGQDTHYSKALRMMASNYHLLQKIDTALICYQQDSALRRKIHGGNHPGYGSSLYELANFYADIQKYTQAESLFLQTAVIWKQTIGESNSNYARLLARLAHVYQDIGKYAQAETLYLQSIATWKQIPFGENHYDYAILLSTLADLYQDIGKYAQAETLYLQSIAILKQALGETYVNYNYSASLQALANLYWNMGKYAQAEPLYLQSAAIIKQTVGEIHPRYATSLNNLGNLYYNMGKYAQAESLYLQSAAIRKQTAGEKHPGYAGLLNNLANLYWAIGKYAQAESLFLQSIAIRKQTIGESHPNYAQSLNNLAGLYIDKGKYAAAESLYLQSASIRKQTLSESHPDYATLLNNLASLYINTGKYAAAESLFLQSAAIWKQTMGENHPDYALSLNNLAGLYSETGKYAAADSLYRLEFKARIQILKNNFSILTESEKKEFLNLHNKGFNAYYAFSKHHNKNQTIQQVYDNVLLLKGLLLQSTQQIREKILSSTDSSLKAAFTDWIFQKNKVVKYYNLSKQELAEEGINLDSLEKDLRDREANLSKKSDIFNDLFLKLIHWQEVQQQLNANEAAIEIVRYHDFGITKTVTDSSDSMYFQKNKQYPIYKPQGLTDSIRYLALILRSTGIPEMVYIDDSLLENKGINDYLFHIKSLQLDTFSYNRFWQPLEAKLKEIEKVYVSLDGVYNQLNLNTLYNPQEKKYLSEILKIVQVPSTRDLVIRKDKNKKSGINDTIYLFGNPQFDSDTAKAEDRGFFSDLPGAAAEVAQISTIKGLNTILKTGKEVTEAAIKSVYNPAVLHIATHGYYEKEITSDATDEITLLKKKQADPMLRSGLVLSGGGSFIAAVERGVSRNAATTDTDDGILTAFEAQNLHLDSTELVVLSACQTGVGEVVTGEGVYGLQRGFQIAGAKYLIMSLWNVNDETTRLLMTTFYKAWSKTKDIRKSFETAQNTVRKQYPQPKYWGAFVLLGK